MLLPSFSRVKVRGLTKWIHFPHFVTSSHLCLHRKLLQLYRSARNEPHIGNRGNGVLSKRATHQRNNPNRLQTPHSIWELERIGILLWVTIAILYFSSHVFIFVNDKPFTESTPKSKTSRPMVVWFGKVIKASSLIQEEAINSTIISPASLYRHFWTAHCKTYRL